MKNKVLLLATFIVVSFFTKAQSGFPTTAEADKFVQTNSTLHKEVEEMMGESWENLTVKAMDWDGYKGTVFGLTLTQCGRNIRSRGGNWPQDGAYAKWIVTGPKNAKGVYKVMGIYLDYDRTSFDGEYCRLGDWEFEGYRLESASEYGHKKFTLSEMKELFYTEAKAGRIDALKYFVEIQQPKDEDFRQNSPQPGQRYLWIYFKGTLAKYASDHSIVYCEYPDVYQVQLSLSEENGVWKVSNSNLLTTIHTKYELSEFQQELDQYCDFPEVAVNYESYESAGWDAVFEKRTPRPTDQGKYGQLNRRIEALYNVLESQGTDITTEDLSDFVMPQNRQAISNEKIKVASRYYMPFQTEPKETSLQYNSHDFSGAFIISKESNGSMQDIAFPGMNVQFHKASRKSKKKWETSAVNPINCRSTLSIHDSHQQPWFYVDGEWYVYDLASVYFSSEAAQKYLEELMHEDEESSDGMF